MAEWIFSGKGILGQHGVTEAGEASQEKTIRRSGPEEVKWAVVAHAAGTLDAEICRGRLEVEGIPVILQANVSSVWGLRVGQLGTVRVLVPEERLQQGQAVLADYLGYDDKDDKDEIGEDNSAETDETAEGNASKE